MTCDECANKDEEIKTMANLIENLVEGVDKSTAAMKVLNLKITEQEATIQKLNNGLMKAANINSFQRKLI